MRRRDWLIAGAAVAAAIALVVASSGAGGITHALMQGVTGANQTTVRQGPTACCGGGIACYPANSNSSQSYGCWCNWWTQGGTPGQSMPCAAVGSSSCCYQPPPCTGLCPMPKSAPTG